MAESQGNGAPQTPQGSGAPGAPSGGEQPKFITAEEFDTKLNAAVSGRLGEFHKKLTKELGTTLGGLQEQLLGAFSTTLDERLKVLKPADPPKPPEGQAAGGQGAAGGQLPAFKLEDHPEFIALKQQGEGARKLAEKLQREANEERQKREVAEQKNRGEALVRTVSAALVEHAGVAPERVEHALLYLQGKNRLAYSDEGKGAVVVFLGDHGEELQLSDGLKAWSRTAPAQMYQPPRLPGGSGGGPGGLRRPGPDPDAELKNGITKLFFGG